MLHTFRFYAETTVWRVRIFKLMYVTSFTMQVNHTPGKKTQFAAEEIVCPLLHTVSKSLLSEVSRQYKEKDELSDDVLLALHSVFGNSFEKALELLDSSSSSVTFLRSASKRYAIQVTGSSGATYALFPGINYCPCPAYNFHVIRKRSRVTCKHVLVAYLCELMGKGRQVDVTNDALTKILCCAANLSDGRNAFS